MALSCRTNQPTYHITTLSRHPHLIPTPTQYLFTPDQISTLQINNSLLIDICFNPTRHPSFPTIPPPHHSSSPSPTITLYTHFSFTSTHFLFLHDNSINLPNKVVTIPSQQTKLDLSFFPQIQSQMPASQLLMQSQIEK